MQKTFILAAAAAIALLPVSCKKDRGKSEDVPPAVSKMELEFKYSVNDEILKAYGLSFTASFNKGEKITKQLQKGDNIVLTFPVDNPKLSADETKNVYEYTLTCTPVPGYTPEETSNYFFDFHVGVNGYDENGQKMHGSDYYHDSRTEGTGAIGYRSIVLIDMKTFTEERGVFISKTREGIWQIGADQLSYSRQR